MKLQVFFTYTGLIFIACSLMVIINYFVKLDQFCSGGCFFDHFFGGPIRALFFLFFAYFILLLMYIRLGQLVTTARRMGIGELLIEMYEKIFKFLKITTFFTAITLMLIIITSDQQKDLKNTLQSLDCSGIHNEDGLCYFKDANNAILNQGKIFAIIFFIIHLSFYITAYRNTLDPSPRIMQQPIEGQDRQQQFESQQPVNALAAIQPTQQDENIVLGRNIENMPQYFQCTMKSLTPNQQELKIGEAVVL